MQVSAIGKICPLGTAQDHAGQLWQVVNNTIVVQVLIEGRQGLCKAIIPA